MNIAFLIDDNYSEQLATTIMSILKNDKSNTWFKFFVLDNGISQKNKSKIINMKNFKNFEIKFLPVSENLFKNLPTIYHLKTMNYVRLLLPSLVKEDRVLFLDCDLLVRGDLNELYNLDFQNTYACVVKERLSNETYILNQIKRLGLKHYFNAGVMLLNLKKMRENFIEEKSLDFVKNHSYKILLLDQCVLNYVFKDNVRFVGKEWNYQYKLGYSKYLYKDYKKSHEVKIIHFVGAEKPYYGYAHPFESEYYKYLKDTAYNKFYFDFKIKMWKFFIKRLIRSLKVLINIYI